jgi:hypothetical protein
VNYEEMLPDWDRDNLSARAALDARLCDMLVQAVENDPAYSHTVIALAADLVENDEVRAMLSSFTTLVLNDALYHCDSREEVIERFKTNRAHLRRIAMEGQSE